MFLCFYTLMLSSFCVFIFFLKLNHYDFTFKLNHTSTAQIFFIVLTFSYFCYFSSSYILCSTFFCFNSVMFILCVTFFLFSYPYYSILKQYHTSIDQMFLSQCNLILWFVFVLFVMFEYIIFLFFLWFCVPTFFVSYSKLTRCF